MSNSNLTLLYPSVISSLFEVIITQPIDVIKIHIQTNTKIIYDMKNLYKGLIPRALGNVPSRTTFLFSQEYCKSYYGNNKFNYLLIPLASSFCQTLIDTPVEIIKMNKILNINNKNLYKGFIPHFTRNFIFLGFVYNLKEKVNTYSIYNKALLGACGGVIGSYISHPFDTIKTYKQSNIKLNNKQDIRNLMKGCHLRASMSFINMLVSLTIFEFVRILSIF